MGLLNGKEIVLGTCYYPEHWPERLWEEDLERMEEAGIRVIRIGRICLEQGGAGRRNVRHLSFLTIFWIWRKRNGCR